MSCVDFLVKKLYSLPEIHQVKKHGFTASELAAEVNVPSNQIPLLLSGRTDVVKWHVGKTVRWVPNTVLNVQYAGVIIRELWDRWLREHRMCIGSCTPQDLGFFSSFLFLNDRPVRSTLLIDGNYWLIRSPNRIEYRDWGRAVVT